MSFREHSIYGFIFIGCGSIGNKITCRRFWVPIFGIAFINMLTIAPYVDQVVFRNNGYLPTCSLVLGFVATVFHLFHILAIMTPKRWIQDKPRLQKLFAAGVVRAESNIKLSAAHKISRMVDNALNLAESKNQDTVLATHFVRTMPHILGSLMLPFSISCRLCRIAGSSPVGF